ncbi:FAD/NAD(P)-binding domain-containing protein [Massarina eburnea CBS 473.64]|uniref:FAD/NAD(P)-binding domain-containing protein n=1 Tax=Massarina eburnea CBS 473.64 TaxID=1395130 RepID=A0A6A6RT35_9PLEO|nr:FAD/NAD(P)-binding domain-containing protein [Massarina eburnea CBS 473.64]
MAPAELQPTGLGGVNGIAEHYDYPPANPEGAYKVLNQYHSKPGKLRVACCGAGASGLCLAYKMERMLTPGSWELTLYEKNPMFGGTWYENTYPGVACDIPSHDYNFTWDPKPDWSQFFASGAEIQKYFESFAERHGSKKYMKLNSKIEEARWDDAEGIWALGIKNPQNGEVRKEWAHVFVNGSGILNTWKWPDIEGLHDFKGPVLHSAHWDHSVDFKGKKAAVIGVGSSSVQITPALQKVCSELEVFIRSSTWISPPFGAGALTADLQKGQDVDPGQRQYDFTVADIKKFSEDPEYHLDFRKRIEAEINSLFGMYMQDSELSNQMREVITKEMHRRMGPGHQDLKDFITPNFSPGCRRISPGDGFLEALVQDNVKPVFEGIKRVVSDGIETDDGKIHKVDNIVCATGFQVAFQPAFTVINGAGKSIAEDWVDGPNLYFGVSAPRFPNYYTIVGPGATWSNGTLLPSIETTVEYSIKCMKKMQTEGIKAMTVKQEALDEIYAHFDEFHKNTVWQEECRSWFKDGKIKNRIYLWPGATIHFLKSIKDPRFEDYDFTYRYKNRFAFLGNGDVKATASKDVQGLSPYIRNSDHDWQVD